MNNLPIYTQNDQADNFRSDLIMKIIRASIVSVDPYRLVSGSIVLSNGDLCIGKKRYSSIKKLVVIGIGKASFAMMQAVMEKLGDRVSAGICVTKVLPDVLPDWRNVEIVQGGHPLPTEGSLQAAQKIISGLQNLTPDDLVLVLVSGGASALVASPMDSIALDDLRATNQALLKCGADIYEINSVRKHLEVLKGGGLLKLAQPAQVHSLILSDVIGNDLGVIASGPTVADESTFIDTWNVVEKYHLSDQLPVAVISHLEAGRKGKAAETLKPVEMNQMRAITELLASNRHALNAVKAEMELAGFRCECISDALVGEARLASTDFLTKATQRLASLPRPVLLMAGGETTVTVKGKGIGGRNLEFALATVKQMTEYPGAVFFTLATDGEDGPTDAAGAVVTAETMKRAQALNLNPDDFLQNNDAYTFFDQVGGLIKIGSTGTNVNDLAFFFVS